jgi:hypothetical protein
MRAITNCIGKSLRVIHEITPHGTKFVTHKDPWTTFHDFMEFQYKNVLQQQKSEGVCVAILLKA